MRRTLCSLLLASSLGAASISTIDGKQMALPVAGSEDPAVAAKQLEAALAQRFDDCAEGDPGTVALAEWYAHWFKGAAISGKYWNIGVEQFQKWRTVADKIGAMDQDPRWQQIASGAWADHIVFFRRPFVMADVLAPYQNLPAKSPVVAVQPGDDPIKAIASLDKGFTSRSPWEQRLLLNALIAINPLIDVQSSYVTSKGSVRESAPHLEVPIGQGKVEVVVLQVPEDGVILVPPKAWCDQAANPSTINLRNGTLYDVAVLKGLTPTKLDISYSGTAKLDALNTMSSIQDLGIAGLGVQDLSILKGLQLKRLEVSDNPITSFKALKGMPLVELLARETGVSDCQGLEGSKLQKLDLAHSPLITLLGVERLPLTHLDLNHTAVSDASILQGMKLRYLDIDRTTINDLSFLEGMPLEILRCDPKGSFANAIVLTRMGSLKEVAYGSPKELPFAVKTKVEPEPDAALDLDEDSSSIDDMDLDLGIGD